MTVSATHLTDDPRTIKLLGVDTGGTFTDFVFFDGLTLKIHKVLSTPEAPERAILQGIEFLNPGLEGLLLVHGSTVATNAVLEKRGVKTVFITNHGFADMLTIGRQARPELYNLHPKPVSPPVPAEYCLETGGRIAANGVVIEPLTGQHLDTLRDQLKHLEPRSVAINLLFSFLDDQYERAIEEVVPEGIFVSRSSEILPEYREYERGITTWLNAWIGPLVKGYLERLEQAVSPATVTIMQSSGGTIQASQAGKHAVNMLLSGPAGGLMGARFIGQLGGQEKLLTFDMGGTSTDVALIDGEIGLTTEGKVGGYAVAVPMVDMHTIGAGGGSIASIDEGGLLQVGPRSAGAAPGPACYGLGGSEPTVTDANLILGRLLANAFLGGKMKLDIKAARQAIVPLAEAMQCSVENAAEGIIRIANENMVRALRVISVQRGIDPQHLTLMSFGGAGGLHVCALANALGMKKALIPVHAGVLSALGMLVAPQSRQLSRTLTGLIEAFEPGYLQQQFQNLVQEGSNALLNEGVTEQDISNEKSMDLRYLGQSYTLNLKWPETNRQQIEQQIEDIVQDFHAAHRHRYGHGLSEPVELVNVRVSVSGKPPSIVLPTLDVGRDASPVQRVQLTGLKAKVPVYERESLPADQSITGPALITENVATNYVGEGWKCRVDSVGNLHLQYEASD